MPTEEAHMLVVWKVNRRAGMHSWAVGATDTMLTDDREIVRDSIWILHCCVVLASMTCILKFTEY